MRRRPIIRRLVKCTLWVTGVLFVLCVLLSGGLLWRLSAGPMPVNFLTPYLEHALAASLGGRRITVQDTVLAWDVQANSLELRARQVTILHEDGTPLATFPAIDVTLSAGALLHGTVALKAINIEAPQGVLVRTPTGTFQLDEQPAQTIQPEPSAAEAHATAAQQSQVLAALVEHLLAEPGTSQPFATLQALRVGNGSLVVHDQHLGVTWHLTQVDLTLRRHPHGLTGKGRVSLAVQDSLTTVEATLAYNRTTEKLTLEAAFTDLRPFALATVMVDLAALAGFDVPVNGSVALTLDVQGHLEALHFALAGGPGHVSYPAMWPEPLAVAGFTGRGRIEGTPRTLRLDEASVEFGTAAAPGPRVRISGTAQDLKNARTVNGHITLTGLQMAELQDYWPEGLSTDARTWLTGNLVAGTLEEATAQIVLVLPGGTAQTATLERLHGTLRYQDCEVHYLRPLPPATGVRGSASFDQQGFRIQVDAGQVTDMQLTGGEVEITGLDRGRDAMAIRLGVHAPLRTALTMLNHPNLNLLADLGINPATTDGQTTTQLGLALPLRGQILLQNVDLTAHSSLEEVTVQQAFLGQNVEHGQLTLALDKAGMTLTGTVDFATVPLTVAWQEAFSTEALWKSDMRVTAARVDHTALDRFGLNVTDFVEGPLAATVTARIGRQGEGLVQTTVNLQGARLALPFLDWHKAADEAGEAQGTVHFTKDQASGHGNFTIQAGSLATRGTLQFDRSAAAGLRLEFRDLVLGDSRFDAVAMEHRRERVEVTLGEGVFDAQPLLRTLGRPEKDTTPGSASRPETRPSDRGRNTARVVQLHAPTLRRVSLGENRYLQDVAVKLTHGPEGWRVIDIVAQLPGPPPSRTVSVQYQPLPQGTHALSVRTNDMGATLRAFDLHDGVIGGQLTLEAQTVESRPEGALQGTLEVKDFTMRRAPILARLLAAASLSGLLNMLHNEGLAFRRLSSDFTLTDRTVTLTLLHTHGGSLGLTAKGTIDRRASSMDVQGTIIPLYGVNTLLGKLPVIGDLLLGGKGQGLVAMTYYVTGKLADPQVSVNPVSALTPGFLRGIFDLFQSPPSSQATDR